MTSTFALLNAAGNAEGTRRNFRRAFPADLEEFHLQGGECPEAFDFAGAVVSGSAASTYHDEAWIDDVRTWLRAADDRGVPLLGVCFGHQILAEALGGSVADMGAYELGYRTVVHEGGPLFEGVDRQFTVFTSHHDEVTDLPPGADLLADNDASIQGFRRGNAFGVQFHPEFDLETARRVAEGKDLPPTDLDPILADITEENYAAAREAMAVFENFRDYARGVAGD